MHKHFIFIDFHGNVRAAHVKCYEAIIGNASASLLRNEEQRYTLLLDLYFRRSGVKSAYRQSASGPIVNYCPGKCKAPTFSNFQEESFHL